MDLRYAWTSVVVTIGIHLPGGHNVYTVYTSCESSVSSFTFNKQENIKYPDRNRRNQHNSNIAAEGDDHARQTQTVPRWNVFWTQRPKRMIIHPWAVRRGG